MSVKRFFLTGAGGFLGGKLLQIIKNSKKFKPILVGQVDHYQGKFELCENADFSLFAPLCDRDVLVLCGAQYYKGHDPCVIKEMWDYNWAYSKILIDRFVERGGSRIVFFGSYLQLYNEFSAPYARDYIMTKKRLLGYAQTKTSDMLNLYLYDNWGCGDYREKLIPKLLSSLNEKRYFEIPDPEALIDICCSYQLCDEIVRVIANNVRGNFSLCTGRPKSLREVVGTLVRGLDLQEEAEHLIIWGNPNRTGSLLIPYLDTIEVPEISFHHSPLPYKSLYDESNKKLG